MQLTFGVSEAFMYLAVDEIMGERKVSVSEAFGIQKKKKVRFYLRT